MSGVQERDRAVQVEAAVHGSGKSVRVRRVLVTFREAEGMVRC
ncbi:hypothetical protein [Streptomyces sp. NPDC060002]